MKLGKCEMWNAFNEYLLLISLKSDKHKMVYRIEDISDIYVILKNQTYLGRKPLDQD